MAGRTGPFAALAEQANADPNLRRLGRTCSVEFALGIGEQDLHLVIDRGQVVDVLEGPFRMRAAAFRIAADRATWDAFMQPAPRPGYHDIFAMSATGVARIEGDVPVLLRHLAFFKALLAAPRASAFSAAPVSNHMRGPAL